MTRWTAPLRRRDGYAEAWFDGKVRYAHRTAYELVVGPIPEGLHIDHLCRVHNCVNPAHLEPVTPAENARRAKALITHCPRGHPYDEANTYLTPARGHRQCKACRQTARERAA